MKSTMKKVLVITIAFVAIGFIIFPKLKGDDEEPTAVKSSAPQRLPVTAVIVQQSVLDNKIRSTGSLLANETVTLRAEVAGIVERIHFKEGQRVKKGQLLVQLNDDEVKAEIEKLQYTKKLNEAIANRQQQLLKKEAISQEEFETATTTLNTTIADIKVQQVRLNKHQIRAPFEGVIGLRAISVGSYLVPSDDIVTVYSINPIKIDFSVPGKYSTEVNPGDEISFRTEAHNQSFTGNIYAIEPQIDTRTRSLKIRGMSANEDNKLLPGQFAQIELTLEKFDSALMIPTEAVIPELNGKKVFISKKGRAESRQIQTGIRTANQIQVLEGLAAGDTILTSGTLQLRPGAAVKVDIQGNE